MNIYTATFLANCPANDAVIHYTLQLESKETIMVEKILAVVDTLPGSGFHEDIADLVAKQLPGLHTIVAEHHGVIIKTIRGSL